MSPFTFVDRYEPRRPPGLFFCNPLKNRQRDYVKRWLNTEAIERMTLERLAQMDLAGEVIGWLTVIGELLDDGSTSGA